MGYGIICTLDDGAARSLAASGDADQLGLSLRQALGDRSYGPDPAMPRRSGPWCAFGSFHSHEQVWVELSADGLAAGSDAGLLESDLGSSSVRLDGVWADTLRGSDHRALTEEFARRPRPHPGMTLAEAALGSPRLVAGSLRSAWWFYADALGGLSAAAAAELGGRVAQLLDTHWEGELQVGSHAAALCRAGALLAPSAVPLVWSGNRLCRAGLLTGPEKERLGARLARA